MKMRTWFAVGWAAFAGVLVSHGMMIQQVGPDSSRNHPTTAQPGWPTGLVELYRHESRVYSYEVNGNEQVFFRATPEDVIELIMLFSDVRLRDHELRLEQGEKETKPFGEDNAPVDYNVSLHVLYGIARFMTGRKMEPATHEPVLTIHIDPADLEWFKRIPLPPELILTTDVPGIRTEGQAAKPEREVWHATVQFDDGTPGADLEHGISIAVTLWEKGMQDGIKLGKADNKGQFHVAFSDEEMASLREGRSWLTLTVGNWLTKAKPDHTRLAPGNLAQAKALCKPVRIGRPGYRHGRVLFEDGAPAVLEPVPWPGAEISVDFPYAGKATVDAQGYFKVYFTEEQYEAVKQRRVRRNIYIPYAEKKGRSSARFAFPAAELSPTQADAGVVKIPRPGMVVDAAP